MISYSSLVLSSEMKEAGRYRPPLSLKVQPYRVAIPTCYNKLKLYWNWANR
jgi:hypothetical protein